MRRTIVMLMLMLCACGGGGAEPPDAAETPDAAWSPDAAVVPDAATGGPDLACLGQAPPTTAPDPVAFGGKVFAVVDFAVTPEVGATVELRARDDDALIDTAITDAEGAFAFSVASGGAPVDAYVSIATATHLPTRAFPARPLVGGEDLLTIVAGATEVGAWHAQVGDTFDPGDATLIAAAVDCATHTLDGSTLAITPAPATLTYYDPETPAWDPTLTASVNGFALATGTAATVALTASFDGTALPARTVPTSPDALTMTVLAP